jgi:hypothetical protein
MAMATVLKNKILQALGYDTRSSVQKILDTVKEKGTSASDWVKERINPSLFPSEEHTMADRIRSANILKGIGIGGLGVGAGLGIAHLSKQSALNNIAEKAFRDELEKIAMKLPSQNILNMYLRRGGRGVAFNTAENITKNLRTTKRGFPIEISHRPAAAAMDQNTAEQVMKTYSGARHDFPSPEKIIGYPSDYGGAKKMVKEFNLGRRELRQSGINPVTGQQFPWAKKSDNPFENLKSQLPSFNY